MRTLLLGALLLLGGARWASAQREPADCAARSAMMLRTGPNDDTGWTVVRCRASGPGALARLWLRPGERTPAARIALRDASGSMRDARILDAVLDVVASTTYSTAARIDALNVLLRYFDHSYAPVDSAFGDDATTVMIPQFTDAARFDGARALPDDARARITDQLARTASSDTDVTFRKVVHRVRQALAYRDPSNTPVSPGAITLVAGCGDRVTLRSSADIDLPIEVRVLGTNFAYGGGIRGGTNEKPAQILLGLPAGGVVAMLGDRELARLTERAAPCPPGLVR